MQDGSGRPALVRTHVSSWLLSPFLSLLTLPTSLYLLTFRASSICQPGNYLREGTARCEACHVAAKTWWIGPLVAAACLGIAGAVVSKEQQRVRDWYTVPANKVVLRDTIQACTGIFVTLQIILLMNRNRADLSGREVPTPYGPFLKGIAFVALDIIQWLPLNCAYDEGFSSWDALCFLTLAPIGAFFAMIIGVVAFELRGRRRGRQPRPLRLVVKKPLSYAMKALLLMLPTISRQVCSSFRCSTFDNGDGLETSLLDIDARVNCESDHYQLYVSYGTAMIFGNNGDSF